jgi:hypothetical protein
MVIVRITQSSLTRKLFFGNPTRFQVSENSPQPTVVSAAAIPVGPTFPVAQDCDQKPPIPDPSSAAVVCYFNAI